MEARLQRWGNSMGLRIPNTMIKSLNLKPDDILDIKEEDNKIIISVVRNKKVSLKERFELYEGENLAKEFKWDGPVGREIW